MLLSLLLPPLKKNTTNVFLLAVIIAIVVYRHHHFSKNATKYFAATNSKSSHHRPSLSPPPYLPLKIPRLPTTLMLFSSLPSPNTSQIFNSHIANIITTISSNVLRATAASSTQTEKMASTLPQPPPHEGNLPPLSLYCYLRAHHVRRHPHADITIDASLHGRL